MGVEEVNPATTSGAIHVMEKLHSYVPIRDGKLIPILCCGDGLSVERMIHAHRARAFSAAPEHRLEGLVETPQEFHKEMLLLQVQFLLL